MLFRSEEIKGIINNIINADENDVIDDSYFTFTNEEIAQQENSANFRKKGIRIIETCSTVPISIPEVLIDLANSRISGTTNEEKKVAISDSINSIGASIGSNSPDIKDGYALELNFIDDLIQNIVVAIVGFILSPKIISIFLINYKIVYGINEEYIDATDFMKQNKNLMKDVSNSIRNAIISILLNSVLKEVSTLVSETVVEISTEKAKNKVAQTLSLVGVPTQVLRLIKGL